MNNAVPDLSERAKPCRVSAGEQCDELDLHSMAGEMVRDFECDRAAGTIAGHDASTRPMNGTDLCGEMGGKFCDACQRFAFAVKARRAKTKKRLIVSEATRQCAIAEHIAVVSADGEDRRASSFRMDRNDRPWLSSGGRGGPQERDNLALSFALLVCYCR